MTGLDEVDKRSLTQEQHGSRPEMCKKMTNFMQQDNKS